MSVPGSEPAPVPQGPEASRSQSLRVVAALVAIVAFALVLRTVGLGQYPALGQQFDEHHYAWAGMSLIDAGRPTSWSALTGYTNLPGAVLGRVLPPGGKSQHPLIIVRPALDHPPLFSLVAGAAAKASGGKPASTATLEGGTVPLYDFSIRALRTVPVLLSVFSLLLLFSLARHEAGPAVALLAASLFATTFHATVHHRLVVPECVTALLLLGNLWALRAYLDGRWSPRAFAALTVFACAAAVLCKVVALSNALAVATLLLVAGRRRDVLWPALGAALGVTIYLGYGWAQGWHEFTTVLGHQSRRFSGFHTLVQMITSPRLVQDEVRVSYVLLFGWIAALAMLAAPHPRDAEPTSAATPSFLWALPAYLLGHVFFAAQQDVYGWHLLPLYPFLCFAAASLIVRVYRNGEIGPTLLAGLILVPHTFEVLRQLHAPRSASVEARALRYAYLAAGAAFLAAIAFAPEHRRRAAQILILVGVPLMVIGELWQLAMALP